jgi:hypothetical protein
MAWLAAPAIGQPATGERRSHIPIPQGEGTVDLEKLFAERLSELEARQDLAKWLKDGDLKKLIEAMQRSGIKPGDPLLQEQLKQFIDRNQRAGNMPRLTAEEMERLKRLVEDTLRGWKPPEPPTPPNPGKNGTTPPVPPDPRPGGTRPGTSPTAPTVDPAAQAEMRERIMRWAQGLEGLARRLGESPALQQAFRDLSQTLLDMQNSALPSGARLDAQLAALNRMARDASGWVGDSWKSLRKFNLPPLPKFNWPSVRMPSVGSLPSVSLSRGLPSLPSAPEAWQTILLVVLGCVLVMLGWKVLAQLAVAGMRQGGGWKLGPWPINPARIATREDVVRAFEYLSLLRLGWPAQHWNHREIARRLGGEADERRRAARELADLYEIARYAPADEAMEPEAIDAARRDLCFLAGVSAA